MSTELDISEQAIQEAIDSVFEQSPSDEDTCTIIGSLDFFKDTMGFSDEWIEENLTKVNYE